MDSFCFRKHRNYLQVLFVKLAMHRKTVSTKMNLNALSTTDLQDMWRSGFHTNHPYEAAGDFNPSLMRRAVNSRQG